jgi:Rrf2 family protein
VPLRATSAKLGMRDMRLTNFSDYALRLLMCAGRREDRLATIEETAELYEISRALLMKVASKLSRAGYLKAVRGRTGGLTLAKSPKRVGWETCCERRNLISRSLSALRLKIAV